MWRRLVDGLEFARAGAAYTWSRFAHQSSSMQLSHLEDVAHLSQRVIRVLGQNPGSFTLQGTNTYLVGSGKRRVLVDTGEGKRPEYLRLLRNVLEECGAQIECIVITHWHDDHTGGIKEVLREFQLDNCPVYKFKRGQLNEDGVYQYNYVEDGHVIQVEGATLKLIATPGHTEDHAVLYLEEEKAVFSGDCILGESTSVFECLHTYMNSLDLLLNLNSAKIFPGHGKVVEEPKQKITEYINHRMVRENQILDHLKQASPATAMQITNAVYPDIPLAVKLGALGNVNHHLSKLKKDGKVKQLSDGSYELLKN